MERTDARTGRKCGRAHAPGTLHVQMFQSKHSYVFTGLLKESEGHVAGERAGWRGHYDGTCGGATRHDRGHVGIALHGETGREDAVEGDAGRAGQAGTENLDGLPDPTRGSHKRDKRAEAHVERVNAAPSVVTAHGRHSVKRTSGLLQRSRKGRLRSA